MSWYFFVGANRLELIISEPLAGAIRTNNPGFIVAFACL